MTCMCFRPDRNCEKCRGVIMSSTAGKRTDPTNYYWVTVCQYCGQAHHPEACPRVKSIEYYDNGIVKRVELHPYFPPPIITNVTVTGYEETA